MFGKESVFQLNFCIDCQHSCFMLVTNYPNLLKNNREQSFLRWPDTVKLPEITLRKTMLKKILSINMLGSLFTLLGCSVKRESNKIKVSKCTY